MYHKIHPCFSVCATIIEDSFIFCLFLVILLFTCASICESHIKDVSQNLSFLPIQGIFNAILIVKFPSCRLMIVDVAL